MSIGSLRLVWGRSRDVLSVYLSKLIDGVGYDFRSSLEVVYHLHAKALEGNEGRFLKGQKKEGVGHIKSRW